MTELASSSPSPPYTNRSHRSKRTSQLGVDVLSADGDARSDDDDDEDGKKKATTTASSSSSSSSPTKGASSSSSAPPAPPPPPAPSSSSSESSLIVDMEDWAKTLNKIVHGVPLRPTTVVDRSTPSLVEARHQTLLVELEKASTTKKLRHVDTVDKSAPAVCCAAMTMTSSTSHSLTHLAALR